MYAYYQEGEVIVYYQSLIDIKKKKKTSYPIARRLFAMRRYGGGILYTVPTDKKKIISVANI